MKKIFLLLLSFFFISNVFSVPPYVQAQSCSECDSYSGTARNQCLAACLARQDTSGSDNQSGLTNPVIGDLGNNPTAAQSGSTFQRYFIVIWQAIINVGGLAVIIMFLWGAIEWITAGGDSSKVGKARDKITQSIIGLVVLVGSFVIISYVGKVFFGGEFDLLRISLPTF